MMKKFGIWTESTRISSARKHRKYDDCCISFDDLLAELNTANPKEIIKLEVDKMAWQRCF